MTTVVRAAIAAWAIAMLGTAIGAQSPQRCRIDGRVTSSNIPLPGVSILVRTSDALAGATSTDVDGRYSVSMPSGAQSRLSATLTGFVGAERDLPLASAACDQTIDFELALEPRTATPGATRPSAVPATQTAPRFQTLYVQPNAAGATAADGTAPADVEDVARLLPPGFSVENAQADAIAITGRNDAANFDRGLLNDRMQAIAAGQFDPATGQFAPGFGPPDGLTAGQGPGGFGGGRGGPGGGGGGPGGRGGFLLGGRGARGQQPYQGSVTYTFGGSVLDAAPYQLRSDVPVNEPQFAQNTYGATFGGPLKIPGLYADTNRRTTFQLNYTGNESNSIFDQYATVPTDAMRTGDFSSSPIQLIDPASGQPLAGNQIAANRIDPSAASLLQYIPSPNLPGTAQNYHVSTTAHTSSEAMSLRLTQNLSPTVAPQGGRGQGGQSGQGPGGRGSFGGGFGGGGRAGGFGAGRGTNIFLSGQLQYRRTDTEALNVFPDLGGETIATSISAPIALTVARNRSVHLFTFNTTHSSVDSTNAFTNTENVAALAGIQYPSAASSDPLNWGVPNVSFSGFTGLRGASASERSDTRLTTSYAWIHPMTHHRWRIGGDARFDNSEADINANARGTFTFTGLYSSGGDPRLGVTGADFADFLLGLPQQASLQVGTTSHLREHAFDLYAEDNWQKSSKLTLNLGLRYELAQPYAEINGRMANLDAAPNFSAVTPVLPDTSGPYTGGFPAGLLNTDVNNLGPRLGFAYRIQPSTILRGGYSITYNSGSYASIARQLVAQPPFADTATINGTIDGPLTLADALLTPTTDATNNWGVDKDYALGMIQTWNATLTRNVTQDWLLQAGYTGIKGSDLDILRAPALGPGGILIPDAQPFIWESSGGRSSMNAGTFQIRRRLAHGYSGAFSYTIAKAEDNASSLGAGGPVVAQNDQDLAAEWGPSNFDRRQQFSGNLYVELPWGPNRRWLKDGGKLATMFGEWSAQLTLTLQTGTPLTARVLAAASDLLRGVNGSLRADYSGGPIQLTDPTVDEFFNVTAFSIPAPGEFGTSSRNVIVGPGARQLNALFQRDLRLGGTRALTVRVNALNLLNTVQWAAVDTNINSPTFGQVISARPMRTMTITVRFRI
jgi:hypothetical protein